MHQLVLFDKSLIFKHILGFTKKQNKKHHLVFRTNLKDYTA